MSRVSRGQFAALLLITDLFALFCLMGSVSLITVIGFAVSTLVQFVIALPAVRFYKEGGTLRNSGKSAECFYLLYLILWGGLLFVMLWNAAEVIYIPYDNFRMIPAKLLISGLIAVTCLYASSPGIKALSRAVFIAAALGIICIAIVVISAVFGAKWDNFTEQAYTSGIFEEFVKGFVLSGGLGSFVVLLGFTKGDIFKNVRFYFIGKLILLTAVTSAAVLVAGGIMEITDYPIITAAQLSQPFSSQRIDSLFLMVFVILAVFAISVQAVLASYLLERVVPSVKRFRSTIVLVLMIGAAFLLSGMDLYNPLYAVISGGALAIIPTIMLIKKSKGGR